MPSADNGAAGAGSGQDARQDFRQDSCQDSRQGFWLSIVRIFVFEVVLLFAISGAFIAYVNWSSEATFSEFLAAGAQSAPSSPPLQPIKGQTPCDRGA
jgi:hypothetical protein